MERTDELDSQVELARLEFADAVMKHHRARGDGVKTALRDIAIDRERQYLIAMWRYWELADMPVEGEA